MTVVLVVAKAPVPGLAKTRLCPPATPRQAASVAAAALLDTLDAVAGTPSVTPVLAHTGRFTEAEAAAEIRAALAGWHLVPQRGDGLADRLANAHSDIAIICPGRPVLQIGMDTPQVRPDLLAAAAQRLAGTDAVLGMAADGGWWALGLRDPRDAAVLRTVPMSTPDTGRLTRAALAGSGLRVADLPVLSDVDTWEDAVGVAAALPGSRFAAAVGALGFDPVLDAGPCWLVDAEGRRRPLPVRRWHGPAEPAVRALVDRCAGPTVDVGCGPGRITAEVAGRGLVSLGIDVNATAVRLTRPVNLYRITQGVHVLSGVATIPLLLAKLWSVYPKLFARPLLSRFAERVAILVLLAAAFFQLVTGALNVAQAYPWRFSFPKAHYAAAWVAVGALIIHIGVRLPSTRDGLRIPVSGSRRAFLGTAGLATAGAVLATAGVTVPWLRRVSPLAWRSDRGAAGPTGQQDRAGGRHPRTR